MTLIAADNRTIPAVERSAVERHFARRGHGAEFKMEVDWILSGLPGSASRVLDIGCGIGALMPAIGLHRVVGIDHAVDGLLKTKNRLPHAQLSASDGFSLPFADASFDAVTSQHVLEHMDDPQKALREWQRVLVPGGCMLIVTPNAAFCDQIVFLDPTHRQLFDASALVNAVQRCGLIVRSIKTLGLPFFRLYSDIPGGWRLRRFVLKHANMLSKIPGLGWSGQSLCCRALRPEHD